MRISDWSSDVCSSDLIVGSKEGIDLHARALAHLGQERVPLGLQILRGLGGDNAEIQFLGFGRLGCATQGQTSQRRCHKGFVHGFKHIDTPGSASLTCLEKSIWKKPDSSL